MKSALFKESSYPLPKLIEDIDLGLIGLPEIQRPFIWTAAKVRDLFDSMYKGFPVGYLLFWANGIANGHKQIGTNEKQKVPQLLIVDGQQRLTSLYAVVRGQPVINVDYEKERIEIAFRPSDAKFEVTDAAIRKDPEFIPSISEMWKDYEGSYSFITAYITKLRSARQLKPEEERALAAAIERLWSVREYTFTTLELSSSVTEEQVAEVFVRINSKGVQLKQADFILTLMSVFWDEGRAQLESFCRESRTPSAQGASPFNHFLQPDPDELLRVSVGVGFHRARLKYVYSILRGKDLETEKFSDELRVKNFGVLQRAQGEVLDLTNWHEFLKALVSAGFRSAGMITSRTAVIYAYVMYLIGKREFAVPSWELRKIIARWFFMTTLTARYSGSPETQMEEDLLRLRRISTPPEFVDTLDGMIASAFTEDYWNINLPNELATSATRSPSLYGYYAALNLLGAKALFSNLKVAELLDPYLKAKKAPVETHHLFPRNYLKKLGIEDKVLVNQLANFAWVEWDDNIEISDIAPADYWLDYSKRYRNDAELGTAMEWHALPPNWTAMPYEDFLAVRRKLMAKVIEKAFQTLRDSAAPTEEEEKKIEVIVCPPLNEVGVPHSSLNPFKATRTVAKVFNVLADGEWHSVPLLETRFKRTLEKRLRAIEKKGVRTRRWILEQKEDQVRLTFKEVPAGGDSGDGSTRGRDLSDTRQTQLRYWTAFRAYMQEKSIVQCEEAKARQWLSFRLGIGGVSIASEISTWNSENGVSEPEIRVDLALWGKRAKARYAILHEKRDKIEQTLGVPVTWYSTETTNSCSVYVRRTADFFSEQLWPEQHQWLKERVELFHRVFLPYVDELRAVGGEAEPVSGLQTEG
jgi:hypothetical protein